MLDPKRLRLAITLAYIQRDVAFFRTIDYWERRGREPTDNWFRSLKPLTDPVTIAGEGRVLEVTDCQADVVAHDGTAIHIYGDLHGRVSLIGNCDVIVTGDVLPGGSIRGGESANVYVGGNLRGEIASRNFLEIWVGAHLSGRVGTGEPMSRLRVQRDCTGIIGPEVRAAMLHLEVSGFMPFDSIERIASARYTQFVAAVHHSDRPAGLYPDRATRKRLANQRSHNRWAIMTDEPARPA
jgi:hypothetical protein